MLQLWNISFILPVSIQDDRSSNTVAFILVMVKHNYNLNITRKSSCVNAGGIPTVAYQVLHMLSYLGRGVTYLGQGGTYLGQGVPTLARGVPTLAGGTYLGWGYLPWPGGTYLGQGVPTY